MCIKTVLYATALRAASAHSYLSRWYSACCSRTRCSSDASCCARRRHSATSCSEAASILLMKLVMWGWRLAGWAAAGSPCLLTALTAPPAFSLPELAAPTWAAASAPRLGAGCARTAPLRGADAPGTWAAPLPLLAGCRLLPQSSNAWPMTVSSVMANPSISLPTPLIASIPCSRSSDGAARR